MGTPPGVVITGASADLGRAIAHAYAKRGAKVALLARNPEALHAAQQECEALGGKAIAIPTDVAWKLCADGALAGYNVVRQVVSFGKLCSWCTGTAFATGVMLFAGREVLGQEARRLCRLG